MKTVVYTSQLSDQVSNANSAINTIIQQSLRNNPASGVTGAMIFRNRQIIQLIEGEESAVDSLFERISADDRHSNIIALYNQPIRERSFEQWSMQTISITNDETFTPESIEMVAEMFNKRFVFRGDLYLAMLQAVFSRLDFMDRIMNKAA